MGDNLRQKKWALFLRHLHLGLYNRLFTFSPSFSLRHFILRVFYGLKLGNYSNVEMGVWVFAPQKISIGEYSVVHFNSLLDGRQGLTIGNCVDIGQYVHIFTLEHDMDDPFYKTKGGSVNIEDHVVIGGRSTILPGVIIGEGAVVATGSIVTKDVPSYTMVAGIPAKVIKERSHDLRYKLTYRSWFQ